MQRCDQCRYDYSGLDRGALAQGLEAAGLEVVGTLSRVEMMRDRPAPEVWSALEYACHVRDVLEVQRHRIEQALTEDRPAFEPMGREERVTRLAYNQQDPATVGSQVEANSRALANAVETLKDDEWERTGFYNYPEPAERTMEWIVRHTIHELVHHRADIEAVGQGRRP